MQRLDFMMEVAERTPADMKGGHLARHRNGRLVLREIAQCPPEDLDAFKDIQRFRFFNTNNLWVNLALLQEHIARQKSIHLPMILNPKALDPRDAGSPPVYQVETAHNLLLGFNWYLYGHGLYFRTGRLRRNCGWNERS